MVRGLGLLVVLGVGSALTVRESGEHVLYNSLCKRYEYKEEEITEKVEKERQSMNNKGNLALQKTLLQREITSMKERHEYRHSHVCAH